MLGVFGIIYVSALFILMEEKERKLVVAGTRERTSGREREDGGVRWKRCR